MKKVLSMILTVVMIASLFTVAIVPVSADTPAGTAITTAAEFAAMSAGGTYYLANDIDLADLAGATYIGLETTFTGNFDGNGHTINLAGDAAFRSTIGGTVKNLKLTGTVTNHVSKIMGTAIRYTEGTTVENIYNEASVTWTGEIIDGAGGIVGRSGKNGVTIKNCVNAGTISVNGRAGGIIDSTNESGGGVGYITGCLNTGSVTSTCGTYAAGITSRGRYATTVEKCVNTGTITSAQGAKADGAAGIMGYYWGDTNTLLKITKCVNMGNVISYARAAGIFAVMGVKTKPADKFEITYCINAAPINGTANICGIYNVEGGGNNPETAGKKAAVTCYGCYYLNQSGVYPSNNSYSEDVNDGIIAVTADQLATGEVAIALNKLIGEPTFYQNVGVDKAPYTNDASHGLPVLPGTGDATPVIILAVLAVLSVFGTAIVIKKLRVKA